MKKYESPLWRVSRLTAVSIVTVSTDDGWKNEWDDALESETNEASDDA
ncbi:MAG: hypothetical protein IK954_08310 [Clostridia bacterium]|nr:hypothetical protein [Clostridia bacterium]